MSINLEVILITHYSFTLIMPVDAVAHTSTIATAKSSWLVRTVVEALLVLAMGVVGVGGLTLGLMVNIAAIVIIVCTHYL